MSEIKWIPVKERLPKDPGEYLVTFINKFNEKGVISIQVTHDEFEYASDCIKRIFNGYNITAWAYMPEPYEEECKDERETSM